VVGVTPAVLRFSAWATAVVTWYLVAPHLPRVGLWPAVAIVSAAVIPGVLLLVLLALPLSELGWQPLVAATIAFALIALGC